MYFPNEKILSTFLFDNILVYPKSQGKKGYISWLAS